MEQNLQMWLSEVAKMELTPEILEKDNKLLSSSGKVFSDPGIYELQCHGIESATSKAGNTYSYFKLTDSEGREAKMMTNFRKSDGTVNVASIYRIMQAFGRTIAPSVITQGIEFFPAIMSQYCRGLVKAKAEYWGFWVKRIEKGNFQLYDKEGKPVLDPTHNEVIPHESVESCSNYAKGLGLKVESGLHWSILEFFGNHTPTEESVKVLNFIEQKVEAAKRGEEVKLEEPQPVQQKTTFKKPNFMMKGKE